MQASVAYLIKACITVNPDRTRKWGNVRIGDNPDLKGSPAKIRQREE
jgi:hypothetical protein